MQRSVGILSTEGGHTLPNIIYTGSSNNVSVTKANSVILSWEGQALYNADGSRFSLNKLRDFFLFGVHGQGPFRHLSLK